MSNLDDNGRSQIEQWITHAASTESMSVDRLNELRSHLIDSTNELMERGLSRKEAIMVATSRVGGIDELAQEYRKTDSSYVWANRVFWMCIGFVSIGIMEAMVDAFAVLGQLAANLTMPNGPASLLNWSATLFALLGWGVVFVMLWRLATRSRLVGFKMTASRFIGITLCLILVTTVSKGLAQIQLTRMLATEEFADAIIIQNYASFAAHILVPILLIALGYFVRRCGTGLEIKQLA